MSRGLEQGEIRELYERYAPVVHRRALALLGREADAWDVVHEVFEKILKTGGTFRREARPMTYVYRISTNLCLNHLRARVLREVDAGRTEGAQMTGEAADARQFLGALARTLNERELTIASLHFVDGLPQEEIVSVVNLSRKTVGKVLQAVREKAGALALPRPEVTP